MRHILDRWLCKLGLHAWSETHRRARYRWAQPVEGTCDVIMPLTACTRCDKVTGDSLNEAKELNYIACTNGFKPFEVEPVVSGEDHGPL